MAKNFTPLNLSQVQKKQDEQKEETGIQNKRSFDINVIFLFLVVVTLAILAVLLFLLIQKKMQELSLVPSYFA